MPSTRKQKAKEHRSRQMDLMSDVENVDIMLGSYSRDENGNDGSENEVSLDSGSSRPQQNSNLVVTGRISGHYLTPIVEKIVKLLLRLQE